MLSWIQWLWSNSIEQEPVPPRTEDESSAKASVESPGTIDYDKLTLGQLITLVADVPTPANRDAFYARLEHSKVGWKLVDGHHIPGVRGKDGGNYLCVCCEVPAVVAAFPHENYGESPARDILEMAQANGIGIIVHNLLDGKDSWAGVPKEHVSGILAGQYGERHVVPPGHKLVIVYPHPIPKLGKTESGVWIAELGSGVAFNNVIANVRSMLEQVEKAKVIWIIQPSVLVSKLNFETLLSELESIIQKPIHTAGHTLVVPYAQHCHLPQIRRLESLGVAMHCGGLHGECFVEVHRPDGTVVEMQGREFTN